MCEPHFVVVMLDLDISVAHGSTNVEDEVVLVVHGGDDEESCDMNDYARMVFL